MLIIRFALAAMAHSKILLSSGSFFIIFIRSFGITSAMELFTKNFNVSIFSFPAKFFLSQIINFSNNSAFNAGEVYTK